MTKFLAPLVLSIYLFASFTSKDIDPEGHCLALNIYFEARSSNLADQYAVADVVLNRVDSPSYPSSICDVVKQGKHYNGIPIKDSCQFSWYCDGKSDIPTDTDAWNNAQLVALQILDHDTFRGISEQSTHYHAHYVHPYWANHLHLVGTIGAHKYYRKLKD